MKQQNQLWISWIAKYNERNELLLNPVRYQASKML